MRILIWIQHLPHLVQLRCTKLRCIQNCNYELSCLGTLNSADSSHSQACPKFKSPILESTYAKYTFIECGNYCIHTILKKIHSWLAWTRWIWKLGSRCFVYPHNIVFKSYFLNNFHAFGEGNINELRKQRHNTANVEFMRIYGCYNNG